MSSATRSSIRRIRMGDVTIGMVGLDEIFIALHSEGYTPDETAIPELLTRVGQYNFIAASAEDEYAEMLLREFRTFCQQQEAGHAQSPDYGTWRGHPRETVPWFPEIYADLCDGCGACLRFCSFGVLASTEDNKVEVVEPFKCQVGCSACARPCKPGALTFPPEQMLEAFGG